MGKSSPKMPAAPDPYATAQAQGQMNKETAVANANLNRINQYTPQGSLTFQQIGTNADGTPQYQSNQTYSPEQQRLYEGQTAVSNALTDLAGSNISRVQQAQSQPFNYNGMTPLRTSVQGGPIQSGYDAGGPIQRSIAGAGDIQRGFDAGGNIQKGLDFSNLSSLPGIGDFGAEAKRAQDAVYNQATSRLDPRFQQEQQQIASSLAAKGVTEGSQAYRNAMDQFARNKTDAYNQAMYSSIGAGGQEQSRLFGLALSGRQQGAQEAIAQGGFANQAQAQQYAQNQGLAQFGDTAQQQQFEQNQAQGEFGNTAQAQQNAQNASAAAFGNTAQQQGFQQDIASAGFNNQARGQQIQEAAYLRNLPLNDIAALLGTGGSVQNPAFADYASVNVAPTDYSGLVQNNYNNQMQQYQIKQQQKNSLLGSVFGLAGGLASKIPFSDRRLKWDIKPAGSINSIPAYTFRYMGSTDLQFGVMADEVQQVLAEAVAVNDNGYAMVDYGKVMSYGG